MSQIKTNVDGIQIKLTNLDKILWHNDNISKAELIQYYLAVSTYMLPLVLQRPLSLVRCPYGIEGPKFYSKNAADYTPEWINLYLDDDIKYICIDKKADLVYLANLASLEIHAMNFQMQSPTNPDTIIFDLDPSAGVSFEVVKKTAIELYNMLTDNGYNPHIKTSGSKGLHIYLPILPIYSKSVVFETAQYLGLNFIKYHSHCTLKLSKEKRHGKILIDIYRNHDAQTCVCPLSTRAIQGAPVSMPLNYTDLGNIHSSQQFNIRNALAYLEQQNPWKDFQNLSTEIPHITQEKAQEQNQGYTKIINTNLDSIVKSSAQANLEKLQNNAFDFMLADQALTIPTGSDFIFEIKWDGIRIKAVKTNDKVTIYSRSGRDLSAQFPEIIEKLEKITENTFILDGELVALDEKGVPVFSKIISRMHSNSALAIKQINVSFYVFDILYLDGIDCRTSPLLTRKKWLHKVIIPNSTIRISETFSDGPSLFEAVKINNMEGIIAKNIHSTYKSGVKDQNWQKIKVKTVIDAIIIGYTKGKGDRSPLFGALHLASLDGKKYLGKVGTGFDEFKMKEIFDLLKGRPVIANPFQTTIEDPYNTVWIDSDQKCEVQYASLTPNDTLREPVFLRLKYSDE